MPRNGTGTYDLPPAYNPVVDGTVIESVWANNTLEDVASALTDSISGSGQTTPSANLPMGGFHHTGVSDPTARSQYVTLGMVQDNRQSILTISQGGNNIVGSLVGSLQGVSNYYPGMPFAFFAVGNNSGPVTLQINAIPAVSLLSNLKEALVDGDIVDGNFYIGYMDGTAAILITDTTSTVVGSAIQASTTGWLRPSSASYPLITIASSSTVTVPAGSATIVPAGDTGSADSTTVTWAQSTITLTYVATEYSTTITVDATGTINQYPGRLSASLLRTQAILGIAEHTSGTVTNVVTKPAVFGDDGYLFRDLTAIVTNTLINGGRVSRSGSNALSLDITAGQIASGGATPNTINYPNVLAIAAGTAIAFRALAGQSTLGSSITLAPVANYDPAGAGTVTALTATNATIHRLYYLYGQYLWVYGQTAYASQDVALAKIDLDRSAFRPSLKISDATLIAEIIAVNTLTDLNNAYIILRGGFDYSIGASGGISDAPSDGTTYGRKNGAWAAVSGSGGSAFTTNVTITKAQPRLENIFNPISAGWSGIKNQQAAGFDWWNIEGTYPDDNVYFRSYNPASGALRNTTTWNLATGAWNFPTGTTINSVVPGDVTGPGSATANAVVLFNGTTGKIIKDSTVILGTAAPANVQTSSTDTTAGRVLIVGGFGLGTTGALTTPSGTTGQRPGSPTAGMLRYSSTLTAFEGYIGAAWTSLVPTTYLATTSLAGLTEKATQAEVDAGTAGNLFVSPETLAAWAGSSNWTVMPPITLNTLTAAAFTGISGATEIELFIASGSLSGTDEQSLVLGFGSTTYVVSGYVGAVQSASGTSRIAWATEATLDSGGSASTIYCVNIRLSKISPSSNIWSISGDFLPINTTANPRVFSGSVDVTAALTAVKLLPNGSNTFDGGIAYCKYQ